MPCAELLELLCGIEVTMNMSSVMILSWTKYVITLLRIL